MDDMTAPRATLVLGGARSGKSRIAEAIARERAGPGGALVYVATAEALDAEMRARIAAHRDSRGAGWRTIDAPLAAARGPVVLVASEVGLGIVPDNALARAFRDHAGRMNQAVAAAAGRVVLVAAGLSLTLKDMSAGTAPLSG